jgi:hypothetical protein
VGRAVGAGLSCLFQLVTICGYYLVAFILGSVIMAVAPLVVTLLVIIWVVVEVRLEGK